MKNRSHSKGIALFSRLRLSAMAGVYILLLTVSGCHERTTVAQDSLAQHEERSVIVDDSISVENTPVPPDLSGCTRIEVTYARLVQRFFGVEEPLNVFSPTEWEYIQSLGALSVTDSRIISALADDLRKPAKLVPPPPGGSLTFSGFIGFVCYQGDEEIARFTAGPPGSIFNAQGWFEYEGLLRSTQFIPPQIEDLVLRAHCAGKWFELYLSLWMYCGYGTENVRLPCDRWCDVLLQSSEENRDIVMECLSHHSPDSSKCHYALNANWTPDAPLDMVFLFETSGGWNQCGGPELFSFDNHNPRGGFVMLNDGRMEDPGGDVTILFIRTEEELKQLRWN
jgi:hypothetical protein